MLQRSETRPGLCCWTGYSSFRDEATKCATTACGMGGTPNGGTKASTCSDRQTLLPDGLQMAQSPRVHNHKTMFEPPKSPVCCSLLIGDAPHATMAAWTCMETP
ncbi:uncharacterized protein PV07_07644 [Cladophialophora immunda]|uniref:Uncharacterized protein n=1 Tax=Cladophialophora immunda TaxID=569365 RepID=A0A0D2CC61_9EURO|nr:uncharacterized protein PV07_07644 [Cladophialophora immunda]KIW27950.1 hypothetical protein PV07_07644 [Cladophialophora immunda]